MTIETELTILGLPKNERPRERLYKNGPHSLSLQELLIIILGQGSTKKSVNRISEEIMLRYANLQDLSHASVNDLCAVKGIGYAKAIQIKASLEFGKRFYLENIKSDPKFVLSSTEAFEISKYYLKGQKKEHLLLFCLDSHGKLLCDPEVLSIGTLDASLIHPREIFNSAIAHSSARIMLAHNHPSGFSDPSDEDFNVTKQIFKAGLIMGIPLIDHIVVGDNDFCSIRELDPEIFKLSQYSIV